VSKILFIPHGFIGDRLLTTSAMAVTKRYNPDAELYLYLAPEFWYMDEVLMSTGVVSGIIKNKEEINSGWDNVLQMPHCEFSTNPVRVYCESFIDGLPMNADLTPAFIDTSNLRVRQEEAIPTTPYITYQVDWQNRTSLNVVKVIDALVRRGIKCKAVGKMGHQSNSAPVNSDEFLRQDEERRLTFNETMKLIAGAELHLCMNGGTAMFAGYVNTRCAMTTDWFYIRHNPQNLDSYAFLNWMKQTPRDMSGNPIHHMFHPLVTEDDVIKETFKLMDGVNGIRELPPNLIKYPELIQYFASNSSIPPFAD
jgi:hypothetical protein